MRDLPLHRATKARLRAAGIRTKEELLLHTGRELLEHMEPSELYGLIVWLRERGEGIANYHGRVGRVPSERNVEIFRLRVVEKLTYRATGEAVGLGKERVRQLINADFGMRRDRRREAADNEPRS